MSVQITTTTPASMLFQFSTNWQWSEWQSAITRAATLEHKAGDPGKLALIFQIPHNSIDGGDFMSNAWEAVRRVITRQAPVIIVTRSRYLEVMFESLRQYNSDRLDNFFVVETMEEAGELAAQNRGGHYAYLH